MSHRQAVPRAFSGAVIALAAIALPVLAAPAAAAASASVVEGRGRFLVTVVNDNPTENSDATIRVDGRDVTATCDFGRGDTVDEPRYHRICAAAPGERRIEVHDPGSGIVFDGRITVQPANGLLDVIDTVVTCLGLPFPTDPTYQDVFCKRIG
ncbi:hypothetical protein [Nocardia cyriacigeorgica]|uniref:hypothetical protein n=1 Tax=Nocardia cyriacigeorgica TaxID=135487 RepID=UPI002455B34B|nr:hypothetical protein [Nocardia cyriacigeorgica]